MTQPSGRVLGSPSRYRTYLRSSPIFCALDALSFLLKLLFSPFLPGASVSVAISQIIRQRYSDAEDEAEGIQSLEKMVILRWVFFLIGTLGPAVKMAAMGGIPWTKAWGMMYLGSFLVFEVMIFAKRIPMACARSIMMFHTRRRPGRGTRRALRLWRTPRSACGSRPFRSAPICRPRPMEFTGFSISRSITKFGPTTD
jgi:hypothetical protein